MRLILKLYFYLNLAVYREKFARGRIFTIHKRISRGY